MKAGSRKNNKANNKKEDGQFHSKHIKHDPNAESARVAFGLKNTNAENKS